MLYPLSYEGWASKRTVKRTARIKIIFVRHLLLWRSEATGVSGVTARCPSWRELVDLVGAAGGTGRCR
jgi:hypothetical protein